MIEEKDKGQDLKGFLNLENNGKKNNILSKIILKLILIISLPIIIISSIIIIVFLLKDKNDNEGVNPNENNSEEKENEKKEDDKLKCAPGYYMPIDNIQQGNCQPCSTDNCEKCNDTQVNNKCLSCSNSFILTNDGNCTPYSFEAVYFTTYNDAKIYFFNGINYYANLVQELIINGTKISPPSYFYRFPLPGKHKVYILFDKLKLTSFLLMFNAINELLNISFSSNINSTNIKAFDAMLMDCKSLIEVNFSNLDTSNATRMASMFKGCDNLISVDLSVLNNLKLTDVESMFQDCFSLTNINLKNFNIEAVIIGKNMFKRCKSLTSIDLSSFNITNLVYMDYMFADCSSLKSLDLSNFKNNKYCIFLMCSMDAVI